MSGTTRSKPSSFVDIEHHVGRRLEDVERDLILSTLTRCGGNRTWASEILGISVRTLRNKLQRYGDSLVAAKLKNVAPKDEEQEGMLARLRAYDPEGRLPS